MVVVIIIVVEITNFRMKGFHSKRGILFYCFGQ